MVENITAKMEQKKDDTLGYFFVNTPFKDGYAIAFPKNSNLQNSFNSVLLDLIISGQLDTLKHKWGI